MELGLIGSIQYFDATTSKWITLLSTSPSVRVRAGAVVHIRKAGVKVDLKALVSYQDVADTKPAIKTEYSPEKRKLEKIEVIDLTEDERSAQTQRSKTRRRGRSISPLAEKSNDAFDGNVGSIPAKLSRFPAKLVGEMDDRLQWMADNEDIGAVEIRFAMVFSCKFIKTTFFRHQKEWRRIKNDGTMAETDRKTDWALCIVKPPANRVCYSEVLSQSETCQSQRVTAVKTVPSSEESSEEEDGEEQRLNTKMAERDSPEL